MGPNPPNHRYGCARSNPTSSNPHFASNGILIKLNGYLRAELYLFQGVLGMSVIIENCFQIFQITCMDAQKVIQSLQLHFSQLMRSWSNLRAIMRLDLQRVSSTLNFLSNVSEGGTVRILGYLGLRAICWNLVLMPWFL